MIARSSTVGVPAGVTSAEFAKLLTIRRETLRLATQAWTGADPLPVEWRRGWRAYLLIGARVRDGSLTARIRVVGPSESMKYCRKVRLVPEARFHPNFS